MRSTLTLSLATVVLVLGARPGDVAAQFPACDLASQYAQANNIGDALFQNGICQNALENAWLNGLMTAVNVPVAGLEPSDAKVEGALGVNTVSVNHGGVSTNFTSGTGAAESPIEALSGFAGLAGALGIRQQDAGGASTEEIPLDRRTAATLERTDGNCKMTTGTGDGLMVQEGSDCDQVTAVGRALYEIIKNYFAN